MDTQDALFKALADSTRRGILDLLRRDRQSTGAICAAFPELSRFAVMKHLEVLVAAKLVLVRREGRMRWNFLNAAALVEGVQRWVSPYAEEWSQRALRLKDSLQD